MTETNSTPVSETDPLDDRTPNLTTTELEIIGYFARGQKQSRSSQNLKLEFTETSIRLSDTQGKLLGISKQVNQYQRKVLVTNSSNYRSTILAAFLELGFVTRQRSSHPEFTEHHHYQVPTGYKLNYTEVIQLWKVWWNNKRYQLNAPNPPIDVLTFTKGNWYLIQDLQPKQGNFILRTERGEMKIEPEDYVIWIDSIATPKTKSQLFHPSRSSELKQHQTAATPSIPLDANLITGGNTAEASSSSLLRSDGQAAQQVRHSVAVDLSNSEANPPADRSAVEPEYIDLESYLNTFNTEDAEDVDRIEGIYNIGELLSSNEHHAVGDVSRVPEPKLDSPAPAAVSSDPATLVPVESPAPPAASVADPTSNRLPSPSERGSLRSIAQRQAALKHKALDVLANYLQHGDLITRTEVLKNAQGQEVNRKVVTIQRGCPSWAIAQLGQLDRELG
jgi:hypothetical protein